MERPEIFNVVSNCSKHCQYFTPIKNYTILESLLSRILKCIVFKIADTYTKFSIEYLNHKGALASYYPDFIAEQKRSDGATVMWLIETKGPELPDVVLKDRRAEEWCRDASDLAGKVWRYLKVPCGAYVALTNNFTEMPAQSFEDFEML